MFCPLNEYVGELWIGMDATKNQKEHEKVNFKHISKKQTLC